MDRRNFFKKSILGLSLIQFRIPKSFAAIPDTQEAVDRIITVKGIISRGKMGITLTHEHLLVDFIGTDHYDPSKWDKKEVEKIMIPYLTEARDLGCRTFIDCTPEYLGRDPRLLLQLSAQSGMNIIIPTGFYGAQKNKFLPPEAYQENPGQLAANWTAEFNSGIGETGIRPGFIKIGVDNEKLSDIHKKLIEAAAMTHINTGMIIASHTGGAIPANEQIAVLKNYNIHPSAFIWVHAQMENDDLKREEAAREGSWISLDGVNDDNTVQYVEWLEFFKQKSLLDRVLLSHDAGWYKPGMANGGEIRGFTTIFKKLIPLMKNAGFSEMDIRQLLVKNPAEAFTIKKRMMT